MHDNASDTAQSPAQSGGIDAGGWRATVPLSLYIHTPWCLRKCPYCDFNSHERSTLPETDYLRALLADLDADLPHTGGRPIHSIFIGGGTPSLLSGEFYQYLFKALADRLTFSADMEVTLEANPGTVEQARFDAYRRAGINRLSIGVQSFNPTHLQALGRIHGCDEALAAVAAGRRAGFDNINLDLMHGLPGQTPAQALADLEQAIALQPTHLSWYELTIEPNTAFFRQPPEQPDSDTLADIEAAGFARLAEAGYQRYEISAFARHRQHCRHNLNYWQFGDYLGIGAGAHGKLSFADGHILRYQKTRLPEHYLAAVEHGRQRHWLTEEDLPLEFWMNALRLVDGVPATLFAERTGLPAAQANTLAALTDKGLLLTDGDRVRCSALGLAHLNTVLGAFQTTSR